MPVSEDIKFDKEIDVLSKYYRSLSAIERSKSAIYSNLYTIYVTIVGGFFAIFFQGNQLSDDQNIPLEKALSLSKELKTLLQRDLTDNEKVAAILDPLKTNVSDFGEIVSSFIHTSSSLLALLPILTIIWFAFVMFNHAYLKIIRCTLSNIENTIESKLSGDVTCWYRDIFNARISKGISRVLVVVTVAGVAVLFYVTFAYGYIGFKRIASSLLSNIILKPHVEQVTYFTYLMYYAICGISMIVIASINLRMGRKQATEDILKKFNANQANQDQQSTPQDNG